MTPTGRINTAQLNIAITDAHLAKLRAKAAKQGISVSALLHRLAGLPEPQNGGAKEGAGRPKKQS